MTNDNSWERYQKAIARVSQNGEAVGLGFLVADRYILTCAHVIEAALGLKEGHPDQPADPIKIEFPFNDSIPSDLKAQVVFWQPVQANSRYADIAGLRLNQPLPDAVVPITVKSLKEYKDCSWEAYGCPHTQEYYWSKGTLRPAVEQGWVQMNVDRSTDKPIVKGFSGSPVWNDQSQSVIGMVVARLRQDNGPAFMFPAQLLEPAIRFIDVRTLDDLIAPHCEDISSAIWRAYSRCLPNSWEEPPPRDLEGIFRHLQEMQVKADANGQEHSAISQFAASFLIDDQVPDSLQIKLRQWLGFKGCDIPTLLDLIAQQRTIALVPPLPSTSAVSPSILFYLNPSQTDGLATYQVSAWLLPNPPQYDPERRLGCEPLTLSDDAEQTYALPEVPPLVNQCINQAANKYQFTDPIIEIFLPLLQLNIAVETWELSPDQDEEEDDPFGISTQIGWQYRVILRSTDRASRRYRYQKQHAAAREQWKAKWQRVENRLRTGCGAYDVLLDVSDPADPRPLKQRLAGVDALGVRLAQVPSVERGKEVAAILATSTPTALWLREPLANARTDLATMLNCPLCDLLKQVRNYRFQAGNPASDIGHHLALLWDNPRLLPPKP